MEWETVIGLEVHLQLATRSKIFSGASTAFGAEPNTQACAVDLGLPGVLPVLNAQVVNMAIKFGLAINAEIAPVSVFARKNYFYPDLPKGYQISQYELPLAQQGWVDIEINGESKRIGITRIHLEEDAGKLIHDETQPLSYVDFNRTGVPLVEIVSEPDLRTPEEASTYLKKLRDIVRYLDICDGNMEEGSLRCDANISLRPVGSESFGIKTELKNMNSFRFVQRALEYEIKRQRAILEQGGTIVQETRLWDSAKNRSNSMRGKEEAHDYRYFPDPDLIPVVIDQNWIDNIRNTLPELPDERRLRFISALGLPEYDAEVLTSAKDLADYFEAALKVYPQAKKLSNWMMTELMRELKGEDSIDIGGCPITPQNLGALLAMIDKGTISGKIAKAVFMDMLASGKDAETLVKEKNLIQVSDEGELLASVREIIAANPGQAAAYRAGETKLMGYFVGQLMQKTKGRANPKLANQLFSKELGQG